MQVEKLVVLLQAAVSLEVEVEVEVTVVVAVPKAKKIRLSGTAGEILLYPISGV